MNSKMSDRRSKTVCSKKKKMKKLKRKFLLSSKMCWVLDEELMQLYQHLIDGYADKLDEEWEVKVKVEESDFEMTQKVKEEPQDDNSVEPSDDYSVALVDDTLNGSQFHYSSSTNQLKVLL